MARIGVLVVTYNQKARTLNWLEQFHRTFPNRSRLRLLLLDNNSTDGTCEAVRREYPNVDIRRLNDNYGCTIGRNVGIVELVNAGCEYICSLDNDVLIEDSEFFDKVLRAFRENPDVDGYGAVVRWGDDRTICTMGSRKTWYGIRRAVKKATPRTAVEYLPGGACVIRAGAFRKYGLYDNDYPPVGGQDRAWGVRVTAAGAKLHYNPETEVFHHHDRSHSEPRHIEAWAYSIQGKMVFLRKNFSFLHLLVEIRGLLSLARTYGPRFVWANCVKGLRRKCHNRNYEFDAFCAQGVARYYASL